MYTGVNTGIPVFFTFFCCRGVNSSAPDASGFTVLTLKSVPKAER